MNHTRVATRLKWQQIVDSQRASGQTAAAYCREHGVTQASFFAWKRRLRSGSQTTEFVEINRAAEKPADDGGIEVCLHGGRRLLLRRGFDPELLIEMIRVLEGLPAVSWSNLPAPSLSRLA